MALNYRNYYKKSSIAQCLMTQTSRNLSTFNIASLMPFFRLITPFLYFYRWFLRQNDVYMQKVPWFFKLKFSAELCRGPGPAGCRTATRRQGHTHTPATTINGDYVAKININSQPKVCKDFPEQTVNNVNINSGGHHPPGFWMKCYCQAAHHWAPSLSLILTDSC